MASWTEIATGVKDLATAAGILAAGLWAWYRFGLRREKEAVLSIDLAHTIHCTKQGQYLVAFDVTFTTMARFGSLPRRSGVRSMRMRVSSFNVLVTCSFGVFPLNWTLAHLWPGSKIVRTEVRGMMTSKSICSKGMSSTDALISGWSRVRSIMPVLPLSLRQACTWRW
jgi:hypothetical protein